MAGAYNELDLLVLDAAKRGDCAALREFLDEGGSANARSASGTPAVVRAAERGQAGAVRLLLARGALGNLRGRLDDRTALFAACVAGSLETVEALGEHAWRVRRSVLGVNPRATRALLRRVGAAAPEDALQTATVRTTAVCGGHRIACACAKSHGL